MNLWLSNIATHFLEWITSPSDNMAHMFINLGFFGSDHVFAGTPLSGEVELDEWEIDVSKEGPAPTK